MTRVILLLSCYLFISWGILLAQSEPKVGGTLIWGRGADSVTLDPTISTDGESDKIILNIFEGLVRFKEGTNEIEPALATSWKTAKGNTEWIFYLRKGVLFHDGTPFNASAVVFSFLRQIDPNHPYFRKDLGYAKLAFKYVKSVEALNVYTVKIILKKPFAPFIYNLAMSITAPIISPAALKKWGNKFALHPVGTGPFIFKEWIPNKLIALVKNPHYWDGPAYLDNVIYKSIPNNRSRLLALKSNAIDGMDGLDPNMVKEIKMNKNLRLISTSCFNIGYLSMNMEKAPFDRLKVRHAVNHSINKQNLVKLLYRGSAIPAKNPIPPAMWGYNDDITDYEYNPEKARVLLRSAGLPNGFKTTLWVMPVPRPYMPQPRKIARAIKANLLAVGIKAKIVSHDWKTYLKKLQNGEHDMCLLGWTSDNGDPDNILYILFTEDNAVKPKAENTSFFRNKALDALLNKAQQILEKQERIKLYRKAQEIIHTNAPWVPLVHTDVSIGLRKNVHGIVLQPRGITSFKRAWLE